MSNNCIILNTMAAAVRSTLGKSVAFDAGDRLYLDYDALLCDFGTNDYTIEFFVNYLGNVPSGQQTFWCLAKNTGTTNTPYFRIYFDAGVNKFVVEEGDTSKILWQLASGAGAIVANKWYHVALVRRSNYIYFYLNGVLQSSGPYAAAHQSGFSMHVAALFFQGNYSTLFAGLISNLRITRYAVYTAAFTPPTTRLTAFPETTLLACQDDYGIADDSSYARQITQINTPLLDPRVPFV